MPLPLPAEQFKIYPEAPVMEESADAGTIIGRRRETYALIPTRPGAVNVPPLTITWWDTANDRLRQTAVDVNNLTITGRPVAPPVSEEAVNALTPAAEGTPLADQRSFSTDQMLRILATAGLALAVLIMGGWSIRRLRTRYGTVLARWLPIHSADEAGRQTDRRRLFKLLQAAAGQQDLAVFRQALNRYLMTCYGLPAGAALETFSRHPEAGRQLEVLNRAIYAVDSADQPDLQTLVTLARIAGRQQSHAKDDPLPALFS